MCVDYAMEHNCDVLLQKSGEQRSRERLIRSKLALLPTLDLYLNQYYNWGRSVDMQELVIVRNRLTQQTSGSIGASFSLFDGFAQMNTIKMNRHLLSAAASNRRQAEIDARIEVSKSYLGNILAKLSKECLQGSLETVRKQIERVRAAVAAGARSHSDILELEAREADILSQIVAAEAEERRQMQQLLTEMGCNESFETCCDTAFTQMPAPARHNFLPGVEAAKEQVEAAKYSIKAARAALMPSITLSAAYGTYYSDASPSSFKDQLDGNQNPSLSLSLRIPILDGGRGFDAVAEARSSLRESEIKLAREKAAAEAYEDEIYRQCLVLSEQYVSGRAKCAYIEELLQIASERYALGAISTAEWLEKQDAALQSECECIQTLCKYLFQTKIIDYYGGKE